MLVRLIIIVLALIKGGDSSTSEGKEAFSAIYADRDEQAGRPLSKRNSLQFGAMIWCKVGRNPLDYNGYGCWCGVGGKGEPVDEIDRCCLIHDKCYDDIIAKNTCNTKVDAALLIITYIRDGCTGCAKKSSWWFSGNSSCQKALCECDGAAARCYQKYESQFQNRYKNHDQSSC